MKKLVTLILCLALMLSASMMMATAENTKIVIGASSTPHAEILEFIKPLLSEKGIDLEIIVYTDYVTPNMALSDGSLDANYFQHKDYMGKYNESQPAEKQLEAAIGVHYEPFALYGGKTKTIDELKSGSIIAIPNDPSNEPRALNLLVNAGIITLREGAGITATIFDIESYTIPVQIIEAEAAQLPRTLADVDMAVINGNYALEGGLSMEDALFIERTDDEIGKIYTNYIVVRVDNKDAEWLKTFEEVICSKEVADFINTNESYAGGVIPVFTVDEAAE